MDCLQNFAKCMNCNLVGHGGPKSKQLRKEDTSHRLYTRDMWTVIDSYTKKHSRSDEANPTPHVPNSTKPPPSDVRKTGNCYQASNSAGLTHLQSVQEESERSEEEEEDSRSGTDSPPVNTAALKSSSAVASNGGRTVKPSKRSRFK